MDGWMECVLCKVWDKCQENEMYWDLDFFVGILVFWTLLFLIFRVLGL